MKTMKNIVFPSIFKTAFVAVLFGTFSCGNNEKPTDTKEIAQEQNEAKFDDADKEKDAKFLVKAAEINLEEIQLGQLAQEKATLTDVKELGKMMEQSHKKGQD